MKKQYMASKMVVVEMKHKTALLTSSPNTMPITNDPDSIIDDPEDIH